MKFYIEPFRRYFYLVWALALLILGTVNLIQVAPNVGAAYGGFVWIATPSSPYLVGQVPWRARPPNPTELRYADAILSVDGRPPAAARAIFTTKSPGELVTYELTRRGQSLTIAEPLRVFGWDTFLLVHGLLYLAAVACPLAGYILLPSTARLPADIGLPHAGDRGRC
ncbi:MAG: hypothetical protein R2856_29300 [Caldilineaceae bacterium]